MWAAVRWNAALMNGNPYAQWEQCGISLHLMPWSAALCHGMRILHRAFPAEYGQMEQHFARQSIR